MVSTQSVEKQFKRIHFNQHAWGRAEAQELPNILLPDEIIHECVNGIYEGGFALLVATNVRMLLVDKKPLNYLTVEDMRFDMINEIDYSHRLLGAKISVSAGSKNLEFRSYNQPRLRKLINHVQHGIAEAKRQISTHQEGQNQHLEQINQQLQAYLIAQQSQQEELRKQLENRRVEHQDPSDIVPTLLPILELPKPSPELNDYLLAQRLLEQVRQPEPQAVAVAPVEQVEPAYPVQQAGVSNQTHSEMADLYAEGMQEIFGRRAERLAAASPAPAATEQPLSTFAPMPTVGNPLEINPLRIAYSKLPMALRNRKFGRPSFHAHSQAPAPSSLL